MGTFSCTLKSMEEIDVERARVGKDEDRLNELCLDHFENAIEKRVLIKDSSIFQQTSSWLIKGILAGILGSVGPMLACVPILLIMLAYLGIGEGIVFFGVFLDGAMKDPYGLLILAVGPISAFTIWIVHSFEKEHRFALVSGFFSLMVARLIYGCSTCSRHWYLPYEYLMNELIILYCSIVLGHLVSGYFVKKPRDYWIRSLVALITVALINGSVWMLTSGKLLRPWQLLILCIYTAFGFAVVIPGYLVLREEYFCIEEHIEERLKQ